MLFYAIFVIIAKLHSTELYIIRLICISLQIGRVWFCLCSHQQCGRRVRARSGSSACHTLDLAGFAVFYIPSTVFLYRFCIHVQGDSVHDRLGWWWWWSVMMGQARPWMKDNHAIIIISRSRVKSKRKCHHHLHSLNDSVKDHERALFYVCCFVGYIENTDAIWTREWATRVWPGLAKTKAGQLLNSFHDMIGLISGISRFLWNIRVYFFYYTRLVLTPPLGAQLVGLVLGCSTFSVFGAFHFPFHLQSIQFNPYTHTMIPKTWFLVLHDEDDDLIYRWKIWLI
jgi:hypothetical protein